MGATVNFFDHKAEKFKKLFGVELPVLNAPMPSVGTAELTAAVSVAGGLGVLAGDFLEPAALSEQIRAVRKLTDAPFAVNLRVSGASRADSGEAPLREALVEFKKELGVAEETRFDLPEFEKQLEAILDEKVPVVSVAFGGLREVYAERLEKAGVRMIGAATTLREVKVQRAAGVDAVIVQGTEAAGPRLNFESPETAAVGLLSLIEPAARASKRPVIAAGGIMTGRQIAASLIAGAAAVQLGTAFIRSTESAALSDYRSAVEFANDADTVLTRVFSGRTARVGRTALLNALEAAELSLCGYPAQLSVLKPVVDAVRGKSQETAAMPMGQGAPYAMNASSGAIVKKLAADCRAVFEEL